MTLNHSSPLVRWAYFFAGGSPNTTNLVKFFVMAFVVTPLAWVSLIGLLYLFIWGMWVDPWKTFLTSLLVIGVLGFIGFLLEVVRYNDTGQDTELAILPHIYFN